MSYEKVPNSYANAPMGMQQSVQSVQYNTAPPPTVPTRFSSHAGQLESLLAHLAGMVDRFSRVADRLGGSVPEEAQSPGKVRGTGGSVAGQIEASLEDFEGIMRRAERTVERLETL